MGDRIEKIICNSRTIAVVGISADPMKPSHRVARYMLESGYQIIPVNPNGGKHATRGRRKTPKGGLSSFAYWQSC